MAQKWSSRQTSNGTGSGQAQGTSQHWQWPSGQQYHGHSNGGQWAPTPWTCGNCNATTWVKNKCWQCGLKKSYAQAVQTAAPKITPSQAAPAPATPASKVNGNPVRAKLEEVSSMLMKCAETRPMEPTEVHASTIRAPSAKAGRSERQVKVAKLEASLAALPEDDDFEEDRARLRAHIESLKREAVDSQPIGARIDATRAVLQRAQARRSEAEQALSIATKLVSDADAEILAIEADLESLESALAHPMVGPGGAATEPDDAMQSLKGHLTSVLQHLKSDQCVDQALIVLAESHSAQLLEGFRVTLEQAAKAKQQGDTPTHRLRGKKVAPRPCVTPGKVIRMHMAGKQPNKIRKLGGLFGAYASPPLGGSPARGQPACDMESFQSAAPAYQKENRKKK